MKTGSDIVIETLVDAGVDVCFANPGTTEMWLVKSLATASKIRTVLSLHETVCSAACDGYARMRRKPALCLLHMGPGLANALANLHNAKRARSPVVVVIGDMATWHAASDAPLCMDIRRACAPQRSPSRNCALTGLAETVACSVHIPQSLTELKTATQRAYRDAAEYTEDPLRSHVTTLVLPHDLSWEEHPSIGASEADRFSVNAAGLSQPTRQFLEECVKKIRATRGDKVAFLIGGQAALAEHNAIVHAGKLAAKLGAALYCENSFARIDRGYGRPHVRRLPYFPQDALRELAAYGLVITLDCRLPVAQFGYKDGPSELITLDDASLWQLDGGNETLCIIQYLFEQLEAHTVVPGRNCRGLFPVAARPSTLPDGPLTAATMCSVIAQLQPENAIIVDESITSGGSYWELSRGCPPFTHLTLTGGAIGSGPGMAIGAAIACPDRIVINIQADGSALYSPQALWTQAKEGLKIITVICSNRTYAILKIEVAKQGIRELSGRDLAQLTDLSEPAIDWVHLAKAMGVGAARAQTVHELASHFQVALDSDQGPFLIEAVL